MFEDTTCWIDGEFVAAEKASVSIFDHGFLYGDGIFEGIRFYNGKPFRVNHHLRRLQNSAAALSLKLPYNSAELQKSIEAVLQQASISEGYIRVIITRGVGPLGINPANCNQPTAIIIASELTMISDEQRAKGARAIIASTRRNTPDRLDPRIKSLNYLNAIMARLEANYAGVDEAILLNDRGCVTEGTVDNLFTVRDGVLMTPPVTEGVLAGITRSCVLELAESLGLEYKEAVMTPYDLYTADECFLTGTGARLIPVREIDGRPLRSCPGTVYETISKAYKELVLKETA